jgi:hypothetical protein
MRLADNSGVKMRRLNVFPEFFQKRIGKLAPLVQLTLASPMNLEQK